MLLTAVAYGAVGSDRGFLGYGSVPTARLLPQGDVCVFGQAAPTTNYPELTGKAPQTEINGGLVTSPLEWLEVGGILHNANYGSSLSRMYGELSMKVQLPRLNAMQPLLSFGGYDLAGEHSRFENLYFVGGYDFHSAQMGMAIDMGAIYHRHWNPYDTASKPGVTSFLAGEFDMGKVSLGLETSWSHGSLGIAPSVWWKPLSTGAGEANAGLVLGGGVRLNGEESKDLLSAWGEVALMIPLQKFMDTIRNPNDSLDLKMDNQPWFWLDVNPVFDHFMRDTVMMYRGLVDVQAVVRFPLDGFFWVNGLDIPVQHSKDQAELVPREIWDRSYLLFSKEEYHGSSIHFRNPQVGIGLMQAHSLGMVIWQEFRFGEWAPSMLTLSSLVGDRDGFTGTLRQPIHPVLPWFLKWTQVYIEGGMFPEKTVAAFAGLRQGGKRNYLDIAAGYDATNTTMLAKAVLCFDFSSPFTTRIGGAQVSAFSHVEHRVEGLLANPNNPDFTPAIVGNSAMEYVGIPWESKEWKGDSLRVIHQEKPVEHVDSLAKLDSLAIEKIYNERVILNTAKKPIPIDSTAQKLVNTGLLDSDHDGIPDELDACPNAPEDFDGNEDWDGCPDTDNDHDGVVDSVDKCPNQPDIHDGKHGANGGP